MIAKEMKKIQSFECKYAEGVEKRTHRRLLKKHLSLDYIFKPRAAMASVTEREKRSSMCMGKRV
jgi:hypothetical protein